jgi:Zn finger protein HypA/HybF involved in hydrogenase expression
MKNIIDEAITLNNKKFEVPEFELYCEKCGTTSFFYDDNKQPYKCDNCGKLLDVEKDRLRETSNAHS